MERLLRIYDDPNEADRDDRVYWALRTPSEKLSALGALRAIWMTSDGQRMARTIEVLTDP